MRRKRVLVLGCGPAGLFAAHAAREAGAEVVVASKKRKSHLFGAQYLQMPIPGLVDEHEKFMVEFQLSGTFLDYKRKVYGDQLPDPDAVAEGSFFHSKPAWDIRKAYDAAWFMYEPDVVHVELTGDIVLDLSARFKPHLIVSTIPLPAICREPGRHAFSAQTLWAIGDAPERGQFVDNLIAIPDNQVWYDGTPDRGWHRAAQIAGYSTVEWPEANKPPLSDVAEVSKPVATSCICFDEKRFIKAGRYGAWNWAGQSHHSYTLTKEALA